MRKNNCVKKTKIIYIRKIIMDKNVIDLLKKTNIIIEDEKIINGMIIPREILLRTDKYDEIGEEIKKLKKIFSSSKLTSLQKTAKQNQKWPLLNLVRQLLKVSNIIMKPKRKSDGYDKNGKKKFKRFFILEFIKNTKEEIKEIKEK